MRFPKAQTGDICSANKFKRCVCPLAIYARDAWRSSFAQEDVPEPLQQPLHKRLHSCRRRLRLRRLCTAGVAFLVHAPACAITCGSKHANQYAQLNPVEPDFNPAHLHLS